MMRHVAKKYTRKLRKSNQGQLEKRKTGNDERKPGWDDTVSDLSTMKLSQDQLNRRLSERKPRTVKSSIRDFPGFPSQNNPAPLNCSLDTPELDQQSAPGNVDYGAVLDSLATLSMSARTRRSSRPRSACSNSSGSYGSEDQNMHLQHPSEGELSHQKDHDFPDSPKAAPVTQAAIHPVSTSSRASGSHRQGAGAGADAGDALPGSEIPSAPKRACATVVTASKQARSDDGLAEKVAALERRFAALEGLPAVVRSIQASIDQLGATQSGLRSEVSEHRSHSSALLSQLQAQIGSVLAAGPGLSGKEGQHTPIHSIPFSSGSHGQVHPGAADPKPLTPVAALLRSSHSLTAPSLAMASPEHIAALQTAHAAASGLVAGTLPPHPGAHAESSQHTPGQAEHHPPAAERPAMQYAQATSAASVEAGNDAPSPSEQPDGVRGGIAALAQGSPVSLKCAVSRPASTRSESMRAGWDAQSASGHQMQAAAGDASSDGTPAERNRSQPGDSASLPADSRRDAAWQGGFGSPEASPAVAAADDPQAGAAADVHAAGTAGGPAEDTESERSWRQVSESQGGLRDEGSEQRSDGLCLGPRVPTAGASTPALGPPSTQPAPRTEDDMAGILQDLGEAIESVAIDTASPPPPSFSPYGPGAAAPYTHPAPHTRSLQPFPPGALDGPQATPQARGSFQVHSSASRSPSASFAGALDGGGMPSAAGNRYLARLKLPTAQPSIAGRSWLQGSAPMTSAPAAGGGGDGGVCGPSGFDPVAGLLGFSAGPRSGRDGVALHYAAADAQAARVGDSWGSTALKYQGLNDGVLAETARSIPDKLSPVSAAAWPPSKHGAPHASPYSAGAFDRENVGRAGATWGSSARAASGSRCSDRGAAAEVAGRPQRAVAAAWPPGPSAGGAASLEATVEALGGFVEDEMPTFSEFKKVRASRKGLQPS